MSSLATSSPVSASTLAYLMRWPVFRLSWLNETFSDSDVAGYSATGQVTSERRRKPFQFARGAMNAVLQTGRTVRTQDERGALVPTSAMRPGTHDVWDLWRSTISRKVPCKKGAASEECCRRQTTSSVYDGKTATGLSHGR